MVAPETPSSATPGESSTGGSPDRLLTFVDAIVAIAITLLVLPVVDETARADPRHESLEQFLGDNAGLLVAFFISFVVIFGLWRSHHRLFERVREADGVLRAWTELWILTIVLVPFTTQLTVTFGEGRLAETLYIGGLLLSSLCVAAMGLHAARTPTLLRAEYRGQSAGMEVSLTYCGLFAVALAIALLVPGAGYRSLLLLLLAYPVKTAWQRWARRRAA